MMDEPTVHIDETAGPQKKKRGGQASIRTDKTRRRSETQSIHHPGIAHSGVLCMPIRKEKDPNVELGLCYALPEVD